MKKIDFEVNTKYGHFKSSLTVEESTSTAEIEQIKQQLVDSWVSMLESTPAISDIDQESNQDTGITEDQNG